jgi:hypothetical protein
MCTGLIFIIRRIASMVETIFCVYISYIINYFFRIDFYFTVMKSLESLRKLNFDKYVICTPTPITKFIFFYPPPI